MKCLLELRAIATAMVAACLSSESVFAAIVAGFDIPQSGFGTGTAVSPTSVEAHATVSALSATGNLSPSGVDGNHFYMRGWSPVVEFSKFYRTTITIEEGFQASFDNITFSVEDAGTSGPGQYNTFHIRSSLDGFSSDIDSLVLSNTSGLVINHKTNLSGLPSITGSIEFRFYATAGSTSHLVGFANHLPGGSGGGLTDVGQNIRFNGSITAVPEPAAVLIVGLAAMSGALRRRRRILFRPNDGGPDAQADKDTQSIL